LRGCGILEIGHGAGVWVFSSFSAESWIVEMEKEEERKGGGGLEAVRLEGKAWVGEW